MEDVGLWRVLDYGGCSTTEVLDNRSVGLQRCLLTEVLDYGGCWILWRMLDYGGCWIKEDVGLWRMLDNGVRTHAAHTSHSPYFSLDCFLLLQ